MLLSSSSRCNSTNNCLLQLIGMRKNIFTWDNSAQYVKTLVAGLKVVNTSCTEYPVNNLREDIQITLPLAAGTAHQMAPTHIRLDDVEKRKSDLIVHNVTISQPTSAIMFAITPNTPRDRFTLFVSLNEIPAENNYDLKISIPSGPDEQYHYLMTRDASQVNVTYYIAVRQGKQSHNSMESTVFINLQLYKPTVYLLY